MAPWLSVIGLVAPPLIQLVERLFGSKTGPVKLDTVSSWIQSLLEKLATNGTITSAAPPKDQVVQVIETILSMLKAQGQMPVAGSAIPAAGTGTPHAVTFTINGMTVSISG